MVAVAEGELLSCRPGRLGVGGIIDGDLRRDGDAVAGPGELSSVDLPGEARQGKAGSGRHDVKLPRGLLDAVGIVLRGAADERRQVHGLPR